MSIQSKHLGQVYQEPKIHRQLSGGCEALCRCSAVQPAAGREAQAQKRPNKNKMTSLIHDIRQQYILFVCLFCTQIFTHWILYLLQRYSLQSSSRLSCFVLFKTCGPERRHTRSLRTLEPSSTYILSGSSSADEADIIMSSSGQNTDGQLTSPELLPAHRLYADDSEFKMFSSHIGCRHNIT